ncbi:MAG: efflux RND transporter permease subunit, partial [Gammaproteobacteria bacterium]
SSISKPGETWLLVNIEDFMPNGDTLMRERFYDIRKKVGDAAHQLPAGVQGPFFNDEFGDIYSILYGFNSHDHTPAELKDIVEQARNAVVGIDSVEKAILYGVQPEKVFIELDDKRLARHGIDPLRIAMLLHSHNTVQQSGRIEGEQRYYQLRLNNRFSSLADIAAMPVSVPGGSVIRLDDIARVYRGFEDPARFTMRVNGEPAIALGLTMREGSQLLSMSTEVERTMSAFAAELPAGVEMTLVADQPSGVRSSIDRFIVKLLVAVAIVLLVSYFTLGLRTGVVVALAIPLVLGTVFVAMFLVGIDITRVSLGALVISLGLLVDDAMIVVELMHVKLEQGWERMKAATFAYTATSKPMLSGTLIAAAGFMPVFVVDASPKEILGDLFVVLGCALMASWVVAVIFTPFLGYNLLHANAAKLDDAVDPYQTPNYQKLRALVSWCMRHNLAVMAIATLLFGLTLLGMQGLAFEFFPDNDRPEVLVDVWFPEDTSYLEMERQIARVEQVLNQAPEVDDYVTYIGGDTLRVQNDMFVEQPNANYTKVIAIATDLAAREQLKQRLRGYFLEHQPTLRTRVYNLPYGVPFDYPVRYRVTGEDPQALHQISQQLHTVIANHPDTFDVHDDRREPIMTIGVELDLPRVAASGTTPQALTLALSSMLDGLPVTQYREGNDQIAVVIRNVADNRYNLDRLQTLQVPISEGHSVPLSELARFEYRFEESVIWHHNASRSITVLAQLAEDVLTLEVDKELQPAVDKLRQTLPAGYQIEAGGMVEVSAIVDSQLGKTLPFLLVTLLTILMFQLNSMSKMALVLSTVPLGLIGVVAALLVLDLPFGLVARLGVLALSGIIIRNSIILIDQIDQDVSAGASQWQAVLESTVRRARPIVLTALAAILALIPLTTDYFWGPMAVAMMSGLLVATLLTLLVFPAVYCTWYRLRPAE